MQLIILIHIDIFILLIGWVLWCQACPGPWGPSRPIKARGSCQVWTLWSCRLRKAMTAARGGVWFSESEALSPTHSQSSAAFRAWNLVGHFTEEPWFVPWETDRLARLSTWTILKMDGSTSHQVFACLSPQFARWTSPLISPWPSCPFFATHLYRGVQNQEGQKAGISRQIRMLVVVTCPCAPSWGLSRIQHDSYGEC